MPRTHERSGFFEVEPGEELLPLFDHLEVFVDKQLQRWGSGQFARMVLLRDAGGETTAKTLQEAREDSAEDRHQIEMLIIHYMEGGSLGGRTLVISATSWSREAAGSFRLAVKVGGPEEAEVIGLAQMVGDEIRAYKDREKAKAEVEGQEPGPKEAPTSLWLNPWVVGIGTALGATLAAAVITWLWASIF
ncbi:hypothetical protein [Actinopolymorpha pittospori]|uniref:Uncharacterized protein n=1 Tax=Actinopolymorpha pittospori TaxID=648752 RepID=A0A927RBP0_9ACTN|nr:hypothetical protein [Actinopolymorpha pittospori]MBE1606270.1 hypothetical protein [Actinopolymorpha pittospori]